ncbi:MAG TPA: hypothetical protein VKU87_07925 [Thermomicrobiaceae bacterium]|nr:hypothetical protein [Thermomicrobiaceae bacterium]
MRTRLFVTLVPAIFLLLSAVACGQPQPAATENVRHGAVLSPQLMTPSTRMAPAGSPGTSSETSIGPGPIDPTLAQQALEQVRSTHIVRSGTPKVVFALLAPARVLNQLLGRASLNYGPDCGYPIGLVILKGDFDLEGYAPGFDRSIPAKYIALPYDPQFGFMGIMSSPDGSEFKYALNDPSLPDPPTPIARPPGTPAATPAATPAWHYWPCPSASPAATPDFSKPSKPLA